MDQIFEQTKEHFSKLEVIKENIQTKTKDLDNSIASLQALFQKIHQNKPNYQEHVKEICNQANPHLANCKEIIKNLSEVIPSDQYFKYYNMWQYRLTNICTILAMKHWLLKGLIENDMDKALITKEDTEKELGIDQLQHFYLPLEDYLYGLCNLFSELNRFCVNAVIRGEFEKPFIIKEFLTQLYDGFKLLNLKNDSLRKRFDAIKYDVKRCEEIVYDLSIRGLNPKGNVNLSDQLLPSLLKEDNTPKFNDDMQQE
ncbi:hypothetical protein ABK040_014385 [Willaertia magna]